MPLQHSHPHRLLISPTHLSVATEASVGGQPNVPLHNSKLSPTLLSLLPATLTTHATAAALVRNKVTMLPQLSHRPATNF